MKIAVPLPQALADQHTLIAQRYAGYFVKHPYRAAQQRTGPGAIQVEWNRDWKEPVVVADDRIEARWQLPLSLTFDHRAIDGAPAARFLQTLRERLENPAAWLISA